MQTGFALERVGMDADEFASAEAVIRRGQDTFVEVGQALMAIRDGRGYRLAGFTTFEDYCQKRWGWSRYAGYDYIRAAEVAANVESTQQTAPSLTQARALAPLPVEQQREVAERVDFATATVREVREVVREVRGYPPTPEPEPSPEPEPVSFLQRAEERQRQDDRDITRRVMETAFALSPEAEADVKSAALKAHFHRWVYRTGINLFFLVPESVVAAIGPDDVQPAHEFIARARAWLDALERALSRPLRAVK